jgi:membrane peptidoglycan carboxypeptidase
MNRKAMKHLRFPLLFLLAWFACPPPLREAGRHPAGVMPRDARGGQVNTATTPRPAGSTLKPFVYAQAIDQGRPTPTWVLADAPRHFGNRAPAKCSGDFRGLVTAAVACDSGAADEVEFTEE